MHFESVTKETVDSVTFMQSEAIVTFKEPKVCLQVVMMEGAKVLFGSRLSIEMGYSKQEQCVLCVTNFPSGLPLAVLKEAIKLYFKNADYVVEWCEIIEDIAYVKFMDSSVARKIVSQPPTTAFMGGCSLNFSTTPLSKSPLQSVGDHTTSAQQQHEQSAEHSVQFISGDSSAPNDKVTLSHEPPLYSQGVFHSSTGRDSTPTLSTSPSKWASRSSTSESIRSLSESSVDPSSSIGSTLGSNQPDSFIEDIETSIADDPSPTRVRIDNFIPDTPGYVLEMYLQSLCPGVDCCVSMHGNVALAKFKSAIDMKALLSVSKTKPFQTVLALTELELTSTVLLSNFAEDTNEYVLKLYFENRSCLTTSVVMVGPQQALVTFKGKESMLKVTSQIEPHQVGSSVLSVEEYYPFMEVAKPDTPVKPAAVIWRQSVDEEKLQFLQNTLEILNSELESIKGKAVLENDSDGKHLSVKPLEGSSIIGFPEWSKAVDDIVQGHYLCFKTITHHFTDAKMEVIQYVFGPDREEYPGLSIKLGKSVLTLSGMKNQVDEVHHMITDICNAVKITSKDINLARKHIKFLEKLCGGELQAVNPPVVEYCCNLEASTITVQANADGHLAFEQKVKELIESRKLNEEMLRLSHGAYTLLSSTSNVETILGTSISMLVVDFEEENHSDGMVDYKVFFLSKDRKYCRQAMKSLRPYMDQKTFPITQKKIRVCSTQEWRTIVRDLCHELVLDVTVKENAQAIVLTGDKHDLERAESVIMKFLNDHTNVEERVHFDSSEWRVIHANFSNDLKLLKKHAKTLDVEMVYSKSEMYEHPVVIKGEPDHVDGIKAQTCMLKAKVCKIETKIDRTSGLLHVLEAFEDKMKRLEIDHKSAIELIIDTDVTGGAEPSGDLPQKICCAIGTNGTRLTIFTGDFTQQQGGSMLHFVSPNPNLKAGGTLKLLGDAAGKDMKEDFDVKLSHLTSLKPADIFKTKIGYLKCAELLHAVIPEWADGSHNEEDCVAESLSHAFHSTKHSGHLIILPITSFPLRYPTKVFAKAVVEQLIHAPTSNVEVSVFVEDFTHAKEFEELLEKSGNFQVQFSADTSFARPGRKVGQTSAPGLTSIETRAITGSIGTFITVKYGDMLQETADVYVNSTNTQMDLSQGQLSSKLLKLCGSDLQKECHQLAPLNPGAVVVTDAKNLKCNYLLHVALPDYKSKGSEGLFRETIRNILQTAREKGIQSIVIPSLGAANLNYPPDRSAKILFDEVIAFHSKYPSAIQNFCFVIYNQDVYKVYNREYASCMSAGHSTTVLDPMLSSPDGHSTQLSIVQGNIADEQVDIIVNTTSEDMNLTSNAVSNAILKKAGPKLQSACKQVVDSGLNLCHGEIAKTRSFGSLHCQWVIHAHVPPHSNASDHSGLIEDIVTDCLKKAENDGMKTISFPAFDIGQGGYSVAEAAVPMLKAFKKFGDCKPKSVEIIRIVILDESLYNQFCDHFNKFFGRSSGSHYSLSSDLKAKFFSSQIDSCTACVELQPSKPGSSQQKRAKPPLLKTLSQRIVRPVAVFGIFSASVETCKKVESEIKASIQSKIATGEVQCTGCSQFLMDNDVEELKTLENDLGVEIKFMTQGFQISGVKESVPVAKMKIMEIINKIELAKSYLQFYEWKGEHSYADDLCVQLERAKAEGIEALEMIIDGICVVFNLHKMEEIDKVTGSVHTIMRLKKVQNDYPDTWEPQPIENGKEKACHMFDVLSGSSEYKDAIKEFELTIGSKYTIVTVQRVQCPMEYPRHVALRTAMQQKHQKAPEERRLFHGTKRESIEVIAVQGFNRVFAADANAAVYGKGVYFAVNARYSSQKQYAVPDSSGNQHMFVCNVLIGEYTPGKQGMKVAPEIPGGNEHIQYDTLCDNKKNPTIFVAMADAQAYPIYLITFKC